MTKHLIAWRASVAGTLCALLVACGGGDDPPPETLRAVADVATAELGSSVLVNVLANDVASANGRVSLARIHVPPEKGKVVVEGNQIRYTPNDGHLGTDRLSYVASLENGAEARAELVVTTEAKLTLSGTVIDSPIANANLKVTVGERSYSATTDEQGRYQVDVRLQAPAEMVRLEASGVGGQAKVKLASLAGDAAAALSLAGRTGALAESKLGALRVSHVSTAQEALILEVHGSIPATRSALEAAQVKVDPLQLMKLAASIKLVVDKGVPLPEGIADTLALVRSVNARETFMKQHAAQLSTVSAELATDASLGQAAYSPLPDGVNEASYVVFFGRGGGGGEAHRLRYRADGTAQISSRMGTTEGRWELGVDGTLTLQLDPVLVERWTSFDVVQGQQKQVNYEGQLVAVHTRMLAGSREAALVQLATTYRRFKDGVQQGETSIGQPVLYQQRAEAALADPLRAEEFVAGSRYGGLGFWPGSVPYGNVNPASLADLLEFQDGGKARQLITGQQVDWAIVNGTLELRRADGERLQYRRLQRVGAHEQRWLVERFPLDGSTSKVYELLVVQQDPALNFSIDSLVGIWYSQINLLSQDVVGRLFVRLDTAGNTFSVSSYRNATSGAWTVAESAFGPWRVLADGSMRAQSSRNAKNVRDWIPLAREGNKLMVLEWRAIVTAPTLDRADTSNLQGWRPNIYTLETSAW